MKEAENKFLIQTVFGTRFTHTISLTRYLLYLRVGCHEVLRDWQNRKTRCLALAWVEGVQKGRERGFRPRKKRSRAQILFRSLSNACHAASLALASHSRETHVKPNTTAPEASRMISSRDVPFSIFLRRPLVVYQLSWQYSKCYNMSSYLLWFLSRGQTCPFYDCTIPPLTSLCDSHGIVWILSLFLVLFKRKIIISFTNRFQ